MKKIILSLICLLAVCVCAGAACATSDVDNMAIDESAVPHVPLHSAAVAGEYGIDQHAERRMNA